MRVNHFAYCLLIATTLSTAPVVAQSVLQGVNMNSSAMTEASMTRAEVEERLNKGARADFTGERLNGLDLSNLDFTNAVLRAARLNNSSLANATLDGAVLDQAWLVDADLSGASLKRANLFQTQLIRATLKAADLSGARAPANFTRADLTNANFYGADLAADMKNQSMGLMTGNLTKARIIDANFEKANLSRVIFEFAEIENTRLNDANLMGANLAGAQIRSADISGANFNAVDMSGARIGTLTGESQSNLSQAKNLDRAFR